MLIVELDAILPEMFMIVGQTLHCNYCYIAGVRLCKWCSLF